MKGAFFLWRPLTVKVQRNNAISWHSCQNFVRHRRDSGGIFRFLVGRSNFLMIVLLFEMAYVIFMAFQTASEDTSNDKKYLSNEFNRHRQA